MSAEEDNVIAWGRAHPARFDRVAAALGYRHEDEIAEDGAKAERQEEGWEISRALWGDNPAAPQQQPPNPKSVPPRPVVTGDEATWTRPGRDSDR